MCSGHIRKQQSCDTSAVTIIISNNGKLRIISDVKPLGRDGVMNTTGVVFSYLEQYPVFTCNTKGNICFQTDIVLKNSELQLYQNRVFCVTQIRL